MDKYTCKNLIIDPETQGLEDIIGKEVYFSDIPLSCITWANNNCPVGILKGICKGSDFPFQIETPEKVVQDFACIIPKREEPEPEFVSFESVDEFINAYDNANYSVRSGTVENKMLNYGGIWLKGKISGSYYMVTEIWNNGVVLAGDQDAIFWGELLKDYVLLDDTPCGKLKENK